MQFGTNHLGHFLFTGLLSQALIDGAPGRVVQFGGVGDMAEGGVMASGG